MQTMSEAFIIGYIYAISAYRDLKRAEAKKCIPIF